MTRGPSSAPMSVLRSVAVTSAASLAAAGPAWSYTSSSYTYVRMSLAVPWTLYFVFLACVLIPFVVMIVLAWRGASKSDPAPRDGATGEPPGDVP